MFELRLKNVRQKLIKEKLDGVLISSVSHITYLTGYANFSKEEREAYLIIGADFAYIVTDGRYSEAIKKQVPHLTLYERGYKNTTENLLKSLKGKIKGLGIEEDNLTVAEHKILRKHFKNLKHFQINRSIKTSDEIKKIENSCKLGDEAFKYTLKRLKKGITEKELAFEIELFVKKNSAEFSFPIIVAFGKNSSVPHHKSGNNALENNRFVLLDMGVKLDDYCSDMTRTLFFGKATAKHRKIYWTVLEAQKKAVDFINSQIKAGKKVKAKDVDRVARKYITSKGFPTIPHSLGHGIGLEVHESPHLSSKSKDILKEGMVFSIEPGIYIPEFGGVRIEDLYVSESSGLKRLTNSPKKFLII